MAETLSAQQRAQLFALSTRQNLQMLAKQTATSFPNTLQFSLPKARLLAGLYVNLKLVFNTALSTVDAEKIGKIVRRLSLDLNNGFAPFVISGSEARLYNLVDLNTTNVMHEWFMKLATDKKSVDLNFYLPCTTNPRDPIGLILLQNDQTNVTLNIDLGLGAEAGLTVEPSKAEVKVMVETFSIPAHQNAYPDLTVLKLVNGRKDSLASAGQQIIKLATGTIYRKIIFKITDADGVAMTPADITSNIELVFNQADINYSIDAVMLRFLNEKQFGQALPDGVYVFDFSNSGGLPNLGGTRDFIDSANLTEFWLRFTTGKVGKVEIVTETLARLS